jgi:hypothetical protein
MMPITSPSITPHQIIASCARTTSTRVHGEGVLIYPSLRLGRPINLMCGVSINPPCQNVARVTLVVQHMAHSLANQLAYLDVQLQSNLMQILVAMNSTFSCKVGLLINKLVLDFMPNVQQQHLPHVVHQ